MYTSVPLPDESSVTELLNDTAPLVVEVDAVDDADKVERPGASAVDDVTGEETGRVLVTELSPPLPFVEVEIAALAEEVGLSLATKGFDATTDGAAVES
jgi:hypothetical protein